jgi:hypothetical protein
MFLFEHKLNQAGIADTRTHFIAQALDNLYAAISQCDIPSRRLFAEMHPYAVRAAVEYAKVEDLNTDLWGAIGNPEWIADYYEYETECQLRPLKDNVVNLGDFK